MFKSMPAEHALSNILHTLAKSGAPCVCTLKTLALFALQWQQRLPAPDAQSSFCQAISHGASGASNSCCRCRANSRAVCQLCFQSAYTGCVPGCASVGRILLKACFAGRRLHTHPRLLLIAYLQTSLLAPLMEGWSTSFDFMSLAGVLCSHVVAR